MCIRMNNDGLLYMTAGLYRSIWSGMSNGTDGYPI